MRRRRKSFARVVLVVAILILLCLCFRSCRARDEPVIATDRVYEEDYRPSYEDVIPTEENKRLSLAFSDNYRITDEHPVFYIGYPEENIFDVVLTIKDLEGTEVYRTDFVAPGTNVAIDGTGFLISVLNTKERLLTSPKKNRLCGNFRRTLISLILYEDDDSYAISGFRLRSY